MAAALLRGQQSCGLISNRRVAPEVARLARSPAPAAVAAARSRQARCAELGPSPSSRRCRVRAALAEERSVAVDSSFASLMDEEGEEFGEFDEVLGETFDEEEGSALQDDVDVSLLVDNLGLCDETVRALRRRGIESLFPIQAQVLRPALEGQDLIGRAKTGSGKTLAFALPVVESLLAEAEAAASHTHGHSHAHDAHAGRGRKPAARGRTPRCLILAPTRELAKQVAAEFETVAPSLSVASFYGGTSIMAQVDALRRGVDVVVGTPGRVMDLLERKALVADKVRFVVLDEADQMLDMGFEEDMEVILQQMPTERQTMLFSATLPSWVSKVARKYQREPVTIDLVGEDQTGKLNEDVSLCVMQVGHADKRQALLDVLSVYAAGGKAIVFVRTKMGADEVTAAVSHQQPCEALHGDIAQAQREKTLARFRRGDVTVLIATDVAARGLDIPSVDLVVHYDMPQDSESFLHRSGRTGRAGNKGRAVVMHSPAEARSLGTILKQVRISGGEVIGAPAPADVMAAAARTVLSKLDRVEGAVVDFFMPAASRLLASPQPERVMAAALASMSGFRSVAHERSLLTGEGGMVTVKLMGPPGQLDGFNSATRFLEKLLGAPVGDQAGRMRVLGNAGDGSGLEGVAIDLPAKTAAAVVALAGSPAAGPVEISRPSGLPLDVNEMIMGRRGGGRPPRSDRPFGGRGGQRGRDGWRGGGGGGERGGWGGERGGRGGGSYSRDGGGKGSWGDSRGDGRGGGGGGWGEGRRDGRGGGSGGGSWGGERRGGGGGGGGSWSGRGRQGGDKAKGGGKGIW